MTKMQQEKVNVIRAMETIARCVNNEEVFEFWLINGVADEDINENTSDIEILENYGNNKTFRELMDTFLEFMTMANEDGGLYTAGVVSNKG